MRYVRAGLDMTLDTFPADGIVDYKAYDKALEAFKPGDAATIFTPGPSPALLQVSTGLARRTWRVHRHWLCICSVSSSSQDDTHFEIAMACVKRGVHVLVTKPVVKTLVSEGR